MCDECRTACEHDAVLARTPAAAAPPVQEEPAVPASAGNAAIARAIAGGSAPPQLLRSVMGNAATAEAARRAQSAR